MRSKYTYAGDKGICEICGQPIWLGEEEVFIRRKDEDDSRISHDECYKDYLEDMEEEE